MKRTTFMAAMAIVALAATTAPAQARTYFGFNIGISNAPPPPPVYFRSAPRMVLVPETRVYVIDDGYDIGYDMFRSGSYYYVCDDGYWYRSRSYGGPFRAVDVRYVPRGVLTVPASRWHNHPHGGPPGQMKKHRGNGRGHGRW